MNKIPFHSGKKTDSGAVNDLIEKIKDIVDNHKWKSVMTNSSYESGLLGLSLFYIYYSLYSKELKYLNTAESLFLQGIKNLENSNKFDKVHNTDSVDNHISQLGRFVEFNKNNKLIEVDTIDFLHGVDEIMHNLMKSKIAVGDFDIQSGALAAGYYFLSRKDNSDLIFEYLSELIDGIESHAQIDETGNFYWSSPSLYNRCYLGISHGSALIISFVCNVLERKIKIEKCNYIIKKSIRFLLNQRSDFGKGIYPHFIGDLETGPKQFSLCYGDLGIGYALYRAARLLNDKEIAIEANLVLNDCLTRKKEDNLTLDASITYGAAGLASTFEKIYKFNNDKKYFDAAEYWYSVIPSYAIYNNEFAGFKSRVMEENDVWNISFGWGILGIGISLMKYLKKELPDISSLLLIA